MWRTMNAQARIAIERALLSDEEWEKIAEIAMPMALKNPSTGFRNLYFRGWL